VALADTPKVSIECAPGSTTSSIAIKVTALVDIPGGFSMHWAKASTFTGSFIGCDAEGNGASFSGSAVNSQYALTAGQSITVMIGADWASNPSQGLTFHCKYPFECGTAYVFEAFGHGPQPVFTQLLTCSTLGDCGGETPPVIPTLIAPDDVGICVTAPAVTGSYDPIADIQAANSSFPYTIEYTTTPSITGTDFPIGDTKITLTAKDHSEVAAVSYYVTVLQGCTEPPSKKKKNAFSYAQECRTVDFCNLLGLGSKNVQWLELDNTTLLPVTSGLFFDCAAGVGAGSPLALSAGLHTFALTGDVTGTVKITVNGSGYSSLPTVTAHNAVAAPAVAGVCGYKVTLTGSAVSFCPENTAAAFVSIDGGSSWLPSGSVVDLAFGATLNYLVRATDSAGSSVPVSDSLTVDDPANKIVNVTVYYDANGNGTQDGLEGGVTGLSVTIGGTAAVDIGGGVYQLGGLATGSYAIAINTAGYQTTQAAGSTVSVGGTSACTNGTKAGVLKLGPGGALSLGFWSQKNGAFVFGSSDTSVAGQARLVANLGLVSSLGLRNGAGTAVTFADYKSFSAFLTGASATNMANMLSAQLAAVALDIATQNQAAGSTYNLNCNGSKWVSVVVGTANDGNATFTAAAKALWPTGYAQLSDVVAKAKAALAATGNTTTAGATRDGQTALKNILDGACRNLNFVQ
jgi:hypothetical protein